MTTATPLMVLALILPQQGDAPAPTPAEIAARFTKATTAGFPRWDKDADGYITLRESTRAIADKSNKGDEAAAIAALHSILHEPGLRIGAISLEQVREPARRPVGFPDLGKQFELMAAAVKAPRGPLFGPGAPKIEGIHQGLEGDCYLIATMGAQANLHPDRLRAIFKELPEGMVEVKFYGARIVINELTDSERALAATSGDQGTWISITEKAWGTLRLKFRREYGNAFDQVGWGNPTAVIQLLTGRKAILHQIVLEDGLDDVTKRLDYSFRSAMEEKRIVCAGTDRRPLPPGIVQTHAYAVLGYNPATRDVTLWNPWGKDFQPKGGSGLRTGYETKQGKFTLPLSDFARIFDRVMIQSASRVEDE